MDRDIVNGNARQNDQSCNTNGHRLNVNRWYYEKTTGKQINKRYNNIHFDGPLCIRIGTTQPQQSRYRDQCEQRFHIWHVSNEYVYIANE